MTVGELATWHAYLDLKAEAEKKALKGQEAKPSKGGVRIGRSKRKPC